MNAIDDRYKKVISQINKGTYRKYEVWKLTVQKLTEVVAKDSVPETYQIYVIEKGNEEQLIVDREFAAKKIREFRKHLNVFYRDQINALDREIIKPLWREWNSRFVEPFANVDISTSISVHRAQGSNYFNVFVDADDILKNNNPDEAKRCLYTALTRTSNELHILI
jgi:superfamily I DNA/RNA helicase